MARALAAAVVASLLAVSGQGGAPAQTPKRGGVIVISRPAATEPRCLNPLVCGTEADPIVTQVLEGAYELGPELVSRPNLVRPVTIDRNPFRLTYTIRPQARWSDGKPVTAADFRFTYASVVAHNPNTIYEAVRRFRTLGTRTFQIELTEPIARWRELFQIVAPRHVLVGQDVTKVWNERIDDPRTGRAIGTGPFLVGSWERGRQLTLVRNAGYWGPHPAHLDRFVWRFAQQDPQDPLGPLRRNEIDVTLTLGGAFVSADIARQVKALPGWSVRAWATTGHEHLTFRVGPGGHPALQSKLVRRALAFGIDRVAIARELLAEAPASARRPLDSATFLPIESLYRPAWSEYRYDVSRARRLLDQAGCRRSGDGIYSCGGERLRLRFYTTAGFPDRARSLELVKTHLRAVGVEVDVLYVTSTVFFTQLTPSGDFDAVLFSWVGTGGFVPPEALCGNSLNWAGYCSRLVTRDAQQVDRIIEPGQRARVLNAADRKLARAVPLLPLRQTVFRAVMKDSVRGTYPGGSQFEFTQNSEDWWLER